MARRMLSFATSAALGVGAGVVAPQFVYGPGDAAMAGEQCCESATGGLVTGGTAAPPPRGLSPGSPSIGSANTSTSLPPPAAGAGGGPQKGDAGASSGAGGGWEGDNRCCLGLLYFSQSLHDRQRGPVCFGVRTKADTVQEDMRNPLPGLVDFKYMCIGYSVYDSGGKKYVSKTRSDATTNLPYCEGLEIISSRDVQESPVLLKEGLGGEVVGDRGQEGNPGSSEKEGQFPHNGRNFVKGGDVNVEEFPSRVAKVAKRIMQKMVENLKYMARTAYQVLIGDSNSGKRKDN